MAKITKKQYEKEKAQLQQDIVKMQKRLDALIEWFESFDTITEKERQKIIKIGDYWNNMYDQKRELEGKLRDLESRWSMKDWTYQDWAQYDLVCQNID